MIKRPGSRELSRGIPVSMLQLGRFVLFHPPFSSPKIRPSERRAIILIFFMAITPSLCPLARLSPNNSESNGCAIQKAKCDVRIFQQIQNLLVVGEGSWSQGECQNRYGEYKKRNTSRLQITLNTHGSLGLVSSLLEQGLSGITSTMPVIFSV